MTRRAAVALGAAALAILAAGCGHARPRVAIEVGRSAETVAEGTTLGEAADLLGLRPRSGSLLGVDGKLLRPHAYPGSLLLNGRPRPRGTILRNGDRIRLVDGRDRRERIERRVLTVPGGVSPNPQYRLERTHGTRVVVEGVFSHARVSQRYRPGPVPSRPARTVALTFDDGPSPEDTPRILALLRRLRVHATFFAIGFLADAYPDIVRQERRAGMVVANHSYNHPEVPPFDQLPRRLVDDEIALGAESLARAGVKPTLFRPPAGSWSPAVVRAAEAAGERIVLWSVDPSDWQAGTTAKQIKERVLGAVKPGSIVLLHDGGGDRSATIAALPGIVKGIRHRHLRLVTLSPR